jgi:hypothetical protein
VAMGLENPEKHIPGVRLKSWPVQPLGVLKFQSWPVCHYPPVMGKSPCKWRFIAGKIICK